MYRVVIYDGPNDNTGTIIHSPYVNGQKLSSGSITQVVEGIDSMNFVINPKNAGWGKIKPLTTLIKVTNVKTGSVEFEGRVLKPKEVMSSSGSIFTKQYTCESELAYLLDSSQRHGEYHNMTVAQFLQIILDNHNAKMESYKRFKLGNVTVTNSTDNVYRYLGYENTYDTIKDKLLNRLGGYLVVRRESNDLYLDYLAEVGKLSTTTIKFRRNMKDMSREIDPTEVITRLVPLGAQIESEDETATDASKARVDIKSVNNGLDYIEDPQLIAEFGFLEKSMYFDDINQPNILKTRGQQFMDSQKASRNGFELTPLDLSLNDLDAESIVRGDWYLVDNPVFAINEPLQVIQKDLNIINPLDIKTTIGEKFKTLAQYQVETNKGMQRYGELQRSINNQVQTIGALKTQINNVNTAVDVINVQIGEADIPGLKQSVDDLNVIVDTLNQSIGDIPVYGPVTYTEPGIMIPEDKIKLDELENYTEATQTKSGLFSMSDKSKLDLITVETPIDLNDLLTRIEALETPTEI